MFDAQLNRGKLTGSGRTSARQRKARNDRPRNECGENCHAKSRSNVHHEMTALNWSRDQHERVDYRVTKHGRLTGGPGPQ